MKSFRRKFIKRTLILLIALSVTSLVIMFFNAKHYNKINMKKKYGVEFYNKERFLKSEVNPKEKDEELIIEFFKIYISDEYKNLKNILLSNDKFDHYGEVYKAKKDLGIYYKEIIIHEINEVKEEEYLNKESEKFYSYIDNLKSYNYKEMKIMEVIYSNKGSEEVEDSDQTGSGEWKSYFVLVKKNTIWKIFDIYGHIQ